jgi:5-methylthioadenosine/S-adenosylhomocysteine deaminase
MANRTRSPGDSGSAGSHGSGSELDPSSRRAFLTRTTGLRRPDGAEPATDSTLETEPIVADPDRLAVGAAPTSRRDFMKTGAAAVVAAGVVPGVPPAAAKTFVAERLPVVRESDPHRKVLRGGIVLSLDPKVGDFERADVLISGKKIVAVGPDLGRGGGQTIDCSGSIVMPGFITTHNHQYEALQRSVIPDGFIVFSPVFGDPPPPERYWPHEGYSSVVQDIWTAGRLPDPANPATFIWDLGRPPYDPEDCYISELVACLSQMTQGITMGCDTSQASHSPEYSDAMIQGLLASGRRSLYDYSNGTDRGQSEYPGRKGDTSTGIGRLAKTYFSSNDQLVTLGFAGGPGPAYDGAPYTGWQLGREFGAQLVAHNVGNPGLIIDAAADPRNGNDWSDVTQIHCVRWQDHQVAQIGQGARGEAGYPNSSKSTAWEIFSERGGHASIAVAIEQQMQHGMPPIQMALNHGILPSLSPDVDTNMTPDPFSLMRAAFCIQRALANDLWFVLSDPGNLLTPQALTCRQVLEMTTIAAAAGNGVLDKVGTLTPGKEADIVVLSAHNINIAPMNNVPGAIVTMMDTRHVRDVFVAGKQTVRNGQLVGWNVERLIQRIENARDRVLARINSSSAVGSIPPGNNSSNNPYRPAFLGSCCHKGQNSESPEYAVRP